MSITTTNSSPEPTDDERQPVKSAIQSTFEQVKEYICTLPRPFGQRLSVHAAHIAHEDVRDDALTLPNVAPWPIEIIQHPIPSPKTGLLLRPTLPSQNFGTVVKGSIYRSAYPQPENFGFLGDLNLKTILTLVPEPISPEYKAFMSVNGIQHFQVHIPANKGHIRIGACEISRALEIVLDRTNHPMLIHCNKGKHRTGCVVGCFRRVQGEESEAIYDEYHAYANPKARLLDEAFIEQFNENTVLWMARRYGWVAPMQELEMTPPSPVPTLALARPRA